jgi:hypothetical protein
MITKSVQLVCRLKLKVKQRAVAVVQVLVVEEVVVRAVAVVRLLNVAQAVVAQVVLADQVVEDNSSVATVYPAISGRRIMYCKF